MNWKIFYQNIEHLGLFIFKWVTIVSGILVLFGWIEKFFQWGNISLFSQISTFLQINTITYWLLGITSFLLLVWLRFRSIYLKFIKGFTDNFKGNLSDNWDFTGQWRIPEPGTLIVTGPEEGSGITKLGTYWENYTFTFKAKIINECLGVIIRAQDLNNYYMFQIRQDMIRPHRRVSVPVIINEHRPVKSTPSVQSVQYYLAWQTDDKSPEFS